MGTCKLGTVLECDVTSGRKIVKNGIPDPEEESPSRLTDPKHQGLKQMLEDDGMGRRREPASSPKLGSF